MGRYLGLVLLLVSAALAIPATATAGFGSLSLVSANSAGSGPGNGSSEGAIASADGHTVVFISDASDLVPGDANGTTDVFERDLRTGVTTLVSRSAGGPSASANGMSFRPAVSDDGRYVAFESRASDLVSGQTDTNSKTDIFVHDTVTGATFLVSHLPAPDLLTTPSEASDVPSISGDGRYVAFRSFNHLVSGQTGAPALYGGYYLWDRTDGSIALVTHTPGQPANGAQSSGLGAPEMSADGHYVAYFASTSAIAPGSGTQGDQFLYDVATGENKTVSHAHTGATTASDGSSAGATAVSGDGRYVLYTSSATNLMAGQVDTPFNAGDPDAPISDAFLYDRVSDTSTLVSHASGDAAQATNNIINFNGVLARDGSRAAYQSESATLAAGPDTNNGADVFLYDRAAGTNRLVTHAAGSATATANHSTDALLSISGSDRYVGYSSPATDLVSGMTDANGTLNRDVYLFDSAGGANTLMSHSIGSPLTTGNGLSDADAFAGETLLIDSTATDVLAADTSSGTDLYAFSNAAPVPSFTAGPAAGTAPLDVSLAATGTDPDGSIVSFAWNFGDGSSGSGQALHHIYRRAGTRTVTLTVTDDSGASAQSSKTITVRAAAPSLSALIAALTRKIAGPCHRRLRNHLALLVCGGNKPGKPDLRAYVVNARPGSLKLTLSASEALPSNAAAAKRARYRRKTVTVAAGSSRRVTLKAPRKLRLALKRALRKHGRVVRRPAITLTGKGVAKTTVKHRVVVRGP